MKVYRFEGKIIVDIGLNIAVNYGDRDDIKDYLQVGEDKFKKYIIDYINKHNFDEIETEEIYELDNFDQEDIDLDLKGEL